MLRVRFLLVVAAPLAGLAGDTAGAVPLFQGVGNFARASSVSAVSGDGSTVVGTGLIATGVPADPYAAQAFRWTVDGGLQSLGPNLEGFSDSRANDVSYDGTVIVGEALFPASQAFRWTPGGGVQSIGGIPCCVQDEQPGTLPLESADVVTRDGTQIFGRAPYLVLGNHADYGWADGDGLTSLFPYLPITSVSDDGRYVAGYFDSDVGARWDRQVPFGVNPLTYLGNSLYPTGMTSDGNVIVGTLGYPGFVWENGDTAFIPFLPSAITADGDLIAGCSDGLGAAVFDRIGGAATSVAQLLEANGVANAFSGWQSSGCAEDISDDGLVIVGNGVNASGHSEGWVAIIPEPATGLLVSAGVLAIAASRRRRAS